MKNKPNNRTCKGSDHAVAVSWGGPGRQPASFLVRIQPTYTWDEKGAFEIKPLKNQQNEYVTTLEDVAETNKGNIEQAKKSKYTHMKNILSTLYDVAQVIRIDQRE